MVSTLGRIWITGLTIFSTVSRAVVVKVETETSSGNMIGLTKYGSSNVVLDEDKPQRQLQWSDWSEWSECSRSCGGGIKSQTRVCMEVSTKSTDGNHRRKRFKNSWCVGEGRRSRICNDWPCSTGAKDFRTQQCENFNKQQYAGNYFKWEAFFDEKNQCALNCRPEGFNFYATLNSSVIDGTSCKLFSTERSVCVVGKCRTVGCDGFIDGQQYDVCGICGGSNSTCRLVSGLFTKPFLAPGYNYITDIPENACNLNISESRKTLNLIALRFKNGTYIMNGNFVASPPGVINTAGTSFTIVRTSSNESGFIFSPGPILQPLELLLLYKQTNLGIKYEYRMPLGKTFFESKSWKEYRSSSDYRTANSVDLRKFNNHDKYDYFHSTILPNVSKIANDFEDTINDEEYKPHLVRRRKTKYKWIITSYTPCSRSCGEGTKMGIYSCVRENDENSVVTDRKCASHLQKPDNHVVPCNLKECPAFWHIGDWSQCSVTCGEGIEKRDLFCMREISTRRKLQINDKDCISEASNILRTRPCFRKPCSNGSAESVKPYWTTGTWSMCSAKCGFGVKTRFVKCMAESEDECQASERPVAESSCDMGPCSSEGSGQWLTTEWSSHCTETCGTGVQTRKVLCSIQSADRPICDENSKPESTRTCSSNNHCNARWFAGPWSSCSVDCSWGKQTRSVVCLSYNTSDKSYAAVPYHLCPEKEKPSTEQACFLKSCEYHWYFSSWSSCSKNCDSGFQARKIYCLNDESVPSINCDDEKPASKIICNSQKCPIRGTEIPIQGNDLQKSTKSDPGCLDEYHNCNLVVKARLCSSKYYQQYCCKSCKLMKQ